MISKNRRKYPNTFRLVKTVISVKKTKDNKKDFKLSIDELNQEFEFLSQDDDGLSEVVKSLYPRKIPINKSFYDKISATESYLKRNIIAYKLIGMIFYKVFNIIGKKKTQNLLNIMIAEDNFDYYSILQAFPIFLSKTNLPPKFASKWFIVIGEKISGDLASGPFFDGVEKYAYIFPMSGIKILETYFEQKFEGIKLELAAIMLGAARASNENSYIIKKAVKLWDRKLSKDFKIDSRLCYHRSLISTFRRNGISNRQLFVKLEIMLEHTEEEVDEAFNIVTKCVFNKMDDKIFVDRCLNWLNKNVGFDLSTNAKHNIMYLLWRISSANNDEKNKGQISKANKILLKIQPIPQKNIGTWRFLGYYLHDRINDGLTKFKTLFRKLIRVSHSELIQYLRNESSIYILSDLTDNDLENIVTEFIFSKDKNERAVGLILFKKIDINKFHKNIMHVRLQKVGHINVF